MALPVFVSVCAMLVPDPAENPVTLPELGAAVQLNVVPDTSDDSAKPVV